MSSGGKSASFAEGLFKAIVFTRSTSWIKLNTTVPDTEHWREWLRQAELAANGCRTSDDIVEEVPMPRALRRHGYVTECELHDCETCANHMCSMSPNIPHFEEVAFALRKHTIAPRCIYLMLCEQQSQSLAGKHNTTQQLTHELAGTWGKAHACGVTHETPNPDIFQSDKAFNDIANRLLTKEMTPVPE